METLIIVTIINGWIAGQMITAILAGTARQARIPALLNQMSGMATNVRMTVLGAMERQSVLTDLSATQQNAELLDGFIITVTRQLAMQMVGIAQIQIITQ